MTDFSSRKLILHHFHVYNNEYKSGIGYDIIVDHDLMVQIGPVGDFKFQVLQWDDAVVPMKHPGGLIGQIDSTSR